MKAKRYMTIMAGAIAVVLFSSCVKDELHDTPHPDYGKVVVMPDWTGWGEGTDVPEKWTVSIGGYTGEGTGTVHIPDYLFEPGNYTMVAYNRPEGITVSGTTASVSADLDHAGCINGQPGWLFTCVQAITIGQDHDHAFTAAMRQQVRELTLVIEPTGDAGERITGITGTLGGVAGTLDFATDTHGTPSEVALTFKKVATRASASRWTATVRLLGIAGERQTLKGILTFADGNPQPMTLESDLTEKLKGFNEDKKTPLTLGGTMAETPHEGGFIATISDWQAGNGDGEHADIH